MIVVVCLWNKDKVAGNGQTSGKTIKIMFDDAIRDFRARKKSF